MKATNKVIGINTLAQYPCKIATFLQLENPSSYTSHAIRRTAATILVENGCSLLELKQSGGWTSSTVTEAYIHKSKRTKINNAEKLNICSNYDNNISKSNNNNNDAKMVINYNFNNSNNCGINITPYKNDNNYELQSPSSLLSNDNGHNVNAALLSNLSSNVNNTVSHYNTRKNKK
jgi:hypothetical protein